VTFKRKMLSFIAAMTLVVLTLFGGALAGWSWSNGDYVLSLLDAVGTVFGIKLLADAWLMPLLYGGDDR